MSSYVYKDDSEIEVLKMAQLVKVPFIVFYLARLIFTGQTSHLAMVYPSIALSLEPFICQEIRMLKPLWLSKIS